MSEDNLINFRPKRKAIDVSLTTQSHKSFLSTMLTVSKFDLLQREMNDLNKTFEEQTAAQNEVRGYLTKLREKDPNVSYFIIHERMTDFGIRISIIADKNREEWIKLHGIRAARQSTDAVTMSMNEMTDENYLDLELRILQTRVNLEGLMTATESLIKQVFIILATEVLIGK